MNLKKKIGFNLVIHSLGSLSSFLILYIILHVYGVEKQGEYANLLAIINFVVVLGVFGFPQGFIFLINKLKISHKKLTLFSLKYVIVLFFLICIGFYFNFYFGYHLIDEKLLRKEDIILFALSCSSLILHGLLRGVYLTINQGFIFAIYSILPAILILFFVFGGVLIQYSNIQFLVLISSICLIFFSFFLLFTILRKEDNLAVEEIPIVALIDHGVHSFLQAIFYAVQPLFAFWVIKYFGGNFVEVGYFNIGLFLLQGFLVPITMVAPYLFNYLTKNDSSDFFELLFKPKIIALDFILGIIIFISVGVFGNYFFTYKYLISIKLTQIILSSLPFNIHYRILLPFIHAKGFQKYNTIFGFSRLFFFVLMIFVFIFFKFDSLTSLAMSWSISEITMFFILKITSKKHMFSSKMV